MNFGVCSLLCLRPPFFGRFFTDFRHFFIIFMVLPDAFSVRFCSGLAHAVFPFLCDLPKCDIAESTVKNNTKSTFSRFHSFRVFLRDMCFSAVFPARGLQKNVFFLPQLLEFSGLEFSSIFDLFWLHFRLRNAENRVPGGCRKNHNFLAPHFYDFYRFSVPRGLPKSANLARAVDDARPF